MARHDDRAIARRGARAPTNEYFTPRDVVRLVTTLVFAPDHDLLTGKGVVRTVYDCAAGTGGFLSSAIEQVKEWNEHASLVPYGQELNPETYAICVAEIDAELKAVEAEIAALLGEVTS